MMEEKTPLSHEDVCFQMHDFETSRVRYRNQYKYLLRKYFFLKNYFTSEEAVAHSVFNGSPLLVTKWVFILTIIVSNYQ